LTARLPSNPPASTCLSSLSLHDALPISSSTTPTAGGSVTLTATANQDMTSTPYGISIMDTTAGIEIAHTGSGTTLNATVSQSSDIRRAHAGTPATIVARMPQSA